MKTKNRKIKATFSIIIFVIIAYHWPYVGFRVIDKEFEKIPLTAYEIQQFQYCLSESEYKDLKSKPEEYICIQYYYSLKSILKKNNVTVESYKVRAPKNLHAQQDTAEPCPVYMKPGERGGLVGNILIKRENIDSNELKDIVAKSDLQISYSYSNDSGIWIRLGSKTFNI